jgi:low temperature requirement protein LtrA
VTIFQLGNFLSHHLDPAGFLVFTGLFHTVFFAWADSSAYNSLYVSTDIPHRAVMAVQIVTMMVIAAAIPAVTAGGWPFFAVGYALNRALTAWLYWRARSVGAETSSLAYEQGRNFFVLAAVFALCAVLPRPLAYWIFGAGVVAIQLQYMLPRIGTLRFERFLPRLDHLSERFALLMLILIGEGFFKIVVTLSDKGISKVGAGTLFNVVMGGLSLFALAWVYFDSAGNARVRGRTIPLLLGYWFAQIILMWSALLIAVALAGEVYVGLLAPFPADYGVIGCIGLAVFLAALWWLQTLVEGREITRGYHHGRLRLFGIAMAFVTLVVHPVVPSIIGNLLWGTGLFSQIGWPLYLAVRARHSV